MKTFSLTLKETFFIFIVGYGQVCVSIGLLLKTE